MGSLPTGEQAAQPEAVAKLFTSLGVDTAQRGHSALWVTAARPGVEAGFLAAAREGDLTHVLLAGGTAAQNARGLVKSETCLRDRKDNTVRDKNSYPRSN